MKKITVYTDGACKGNPGPGGWGVLLEFNGRSRSLKGGAPETTNNRMELMAAIMALETLSEPCEITLYTDSKYVLSGLTEWLPGWKARGWRTASKQPVKNQDLWERLDAAVQRHEIHWQWVKGHAGNPGNEAADRLAGEATEAFFARNCA